MQTPKESSIVQSIIKYVNGLPRCHAEKTHGSAYNSGMPDITACVAGRRVELEVKRPGQHATPLQARKLKTWENAEAVVGVVHSLAETRELFKQHGLVR